MKLSKTTKLAHEKIEIETNRIRSIHFYKHPKLNYKELLNAKLFGFFEPLNAISLHND